MASFKAATHDTLRWETTQMSHNGGRWRHEQLQSALTAQAQRHNRSGHATGTAHVARKNGGANASVNAARMHKLFPGRRTVKQNPNSSQLTGGMVPLDHSNGALTSVTNGKVITVAHHPSLDRTAGGVTDETDINAGAGHEVAHYGHGHENKDTEDHFSNGLFPWSDAPEVAAPHYGGGHESKDTEDHFHDGLFPWSDAKEVDAQGYRDEHKDKDTEDHFIGGLSCLLDPNLTAEEDASAVWSARNGAKTISPTNRAWKNRRITPAAPGMAELPNYKMQRQQSERSRQRKTHIRKSIKSQSMSIRASREPPRHY